MKRIVISLFFAGFAFIACNGSFPHSGPMRRIIVTRTSGDPGADKKRIPIQFTTGPTYTYRLEMHRADGSLDDAFDGWVRVSVKPGTILPLQRNVHMVGGVADNVPVTVVASYGDAHVWVEDLGYLPASATGTKTPQCANGIDDNKNFWIDFPADPGCFAPDDDDENVGSMAAGTSDTIYFARPRVADVRGVAQNNGTGTAFPHEQVVVDTGYSKDDGSFAFDVIVTRIASDGFYVTDVQDQNARGFASVFAYTFSPPQKLAICDRLKSFTGTASDFFGFTEVGFPTWQVDFYNPSNPTRPCLCPEPRVLAVSELSDLATLFRYESALVRLQAGGPVTLHLGGHFGAAPVPLDPMTMAYTPKNDASNCDLNADGKLDFSDPPEAKCNDACTADVECSEYTNFLSQSQFALVLTTTMPMMQVGKIQANASSDPSFDPVINKGAPLGAFTGTLRYFSGGQQFTIQARCADDIIQDPMGTGMPSDKACIRPRPDLDLNEGSH